MTFHSQVIVDNVFLSKQHEQWAASLCPYSHERGKGWIVLTLSSIQKDVLTSIDEDVTNNSIKICEVSKTYLHIFVSANDQDYFHSNCSRSLSVGVYKNACLTMQNPKTPKFHPSLLSTEVLSLHLPAWLK